MELKVFATITKKIGEMVNKRDDDRVSDILKKYGSEIEKHISTEDAGNYTREYLNFKKESMPALSFYERLCKNIGKSFKIKLSKKEEEKISKALRTAHLDITPSDSAAFSMMTLFLCLFVSIIFLIGLWMATGFFSIFAVFLMLIVTIFVFSMVSSLPEKIAQRWRLKASSQMVPCILYMVIHMRHSSNLELAIKFASQHLQPPLALDLKKIFWDVETGKYSTVKDALDAYLEGWRDYSVEFIEAFHLIESSLYEPSDEMRIQILEKSLSVILDGVYEKMLHYAHNVKSPLTNLYMLGIVLPTLAIALLPLASVLLQGAIKAWHVVVLFNLIIPFAVYYMTSSILAKRPGGYGETELLELNPNYGFYKSKSHYTKAFLIALPFFILGILPLLLQIPGFAHSLGLQSDYTFDSIKLSVLGDLKIFDFKNVTSVATGKTSTTGPFGPIALLFSLFLPLSIALFFAIAYKSKTKKLIKTREQTKQLESEFASSMFQLGNRLGDGLPAEIAFGRVAGSLRGTPTAEFFSIVNSNIQSVGMSVEEAIFNQQRGAIIYFPSSLIRTSMRILVESVKKGLNVAARALMSISEYVKNIHKVNERLRDLLADVVSGMKSNMTFLAPVLAGIVVGLASMITLIVNKLQTMMVSGAVSTDQLGTFAGVADILKIEAMIPPYWLQLAVGIYLIEIIFILTRTLVSVESGVDTLSEQYEISKNLSSAMGLYIIISLVAIIALTLLAGLALPMAFS